MRKILFLTGLVAIPLGLVLVRAAFGGYEAGTSSLGLTLALAGIGAGMFIAGMELTTLY